MSDTPPPDDRSPSSPPDPPSVPPPPPGGGIDPSPPIPPPPPYPGAGEPSPPIPPPPGAPSDSGFAPPAPPPPGGDAPWGSAGDATAVNPTFPAPAPSTPPPPGAGDTYSPPPPGAAPGAPPPGFPPPGGPQPYQPGAPTQTTSNNGCLKAFLIVLAVSFVLGIIAVVSLVLIGRTAVERTFGTAAADDYTITDLRCEVDRFGSMTARAKFTNDASGNQSYRLSFEFTDVDGGAQLDTNDAVFTESLSAGQTEEISASGFTDAEPRAIQCKVTDVSYFGS